MFRSTCFGRLHAHHQELTTALTASGFTVGALVVAALLVVVWPVNRPDHDHAPDDGRGGARNMLSDT